MKLFKILAPIVLSLGAAFPAMAQGELTCWYNEAGQGTGADSGTHGAPVGQVVHDRPGHNPPSSGDWYWAYVLPAGQWADGNSCPPALDMSGVQSTTVAQDPPVAAASCPSENEPVDYVYEVNFADLVTYYSQGMVVGGSQSNQTDLSTCELPVSAIGYVGWPNGLRTFDLTGFPGQAVLDLMGGSCDTVLLVRDQTGGWHFNDDNGSGTDSRIVIPATTGRVSMWPGLYTGTGCEVELRISGVAGAPATPPTDVAQGELTCWYNEAGQGTGSDRGAHGGTVGQVVQDRPGHNPPSSGDWYWSYVLAAGQWTDGTSCPPALDMSGYQPPLTLQDQEPLSCWYDGFGQSTGADSGNPWNAPLRHVTQNGSGWVFVMAPGEWTDGNSCPNAIDVAGSGPVTTDPPTPTPAGGCPTWQVPGQTYNLTEQQLQSQQTFSLQAGGTTPLSDCEMEGVGYANQQPHLSLNLSGLRTVGQLSIRVTSSCDPTLLINMPSTEWRFDDDGRGDLQPAMMFFTPSSLNGRVDVWVGTYDGAPCPVTLEMQVFY